jgi:hypothetical protein
MACILPAAAWYFHITVCHFSARRAEKWHTKEEGIALPKAKTADCVSPDYKRRTWWGNFL